MATSTAADWAVSNVVKARSSAEATLGQVILRQVRSKLWKLPRWTLVVALLVCFGAVGRFVVYLLGWRPSSSECSRFRASVEEVLRRRRRASQITDPTFGGALGLVYSRNRISQSWEDFLDALNFPKSSPIRGHVRQLFSRQDLDEQLRGLFDALSDGSKALTKGQFERFSRGIHGDVHVLLDKSTRVPLVPPTTEDFDWIMESFDSVFPAERPLDGETFPAVAKLVLLRRVVRTLINFVGLEQLHAGTAAPLVVDVAVDLSVSGRPPFRLHTVAPSSAPSLSSGERLDLIKE